MRIAIQTDARGHDWGIRQRVAEAYIEVKTFQLHNWRTLTRLERGEAPGPEGSALKLYWSEMSQRLHETVMAVLSAQVRYEGAKVPMNDPLLNAAMARLQAEEQARAKADFTLSDIKGHSWTLNELRGKVVLGRRSGRARQIDADVQGVEGMHRHRDRIA